MIISNFKYKTGAAEDLFTYMNITENYDILQIAGSRQKTYVCNS